ncbi:hypothetical protein [Sphingobium boeckii]|uniref:Uncharacterized protein n=1 Tax=Sphingobium boeckii TaxID=1082345 RepID=A0A7W9AHI0_9SPHN|nr:hypothetical protein [Sphingobium boeckii]MBB5685793.1 hypothetical protein [Sphingobium boeckii]
MILALALAMPVTAWTETRRSAMSNTPEVVLVAELPDDPRFEAYGADGRSVALDLGWSYREFSAFWMPFAAWKEAGFVFYARTPEGDLHIAPATRRELASIKALTGRNYETEYRFPYWRHYWGWISVAVLLGYVLWLRRREKARRDADGMM